ncbi:hypothetical protein COB64_03000 [Candidatus Wolfebacteria bacterium]|nr:MAG: hypothetical protein COB64_03000 [Candidatus Wolfebacteria bacterium]
MRSSLSKKLIISGISIGVLFLFYVVIPEVKGIRYTNSTSVLTATVRDATTDDEEEPSTKTYTVTHIETPEPLKAIYMTSFAASLKSFREDIIGVIDRTEVNAIIIDIKDFSGNIAFEVSDPFLQSVGSSINRISDIHEIIEELHEKDIYIIGRISAFQDQYFIEHRPDLAVKTRSDGSLWRDRKGIGWIDAGSRDAWDYLVAIARESYAIGFDELNFDYIRFPSDGNMSDIAYPFSEGIAKAEIMRDFYAYLRTNLGDSGAKLSADLFGMTTTNRDDLNIGQYLEHAIQYFDYVAPMVYPSHFPPGWNGIPKPAKEPYKVIKYSMSKAVERVIAMGEDPLKLRPWLQDFNLGAKYTPDMVRAQIDATYDSGLTSWMMWDAANTYTEEALKKASG